MDFLYLSKTMLLFIVLLKGSLERDQELKEKFRKQKVCLRCCCRLDYKFINYIVTLNFKKDDSLADSSLPNLNFRNSERFSLGINEETQMEEFVEIFRQEDETLSQPQYIRINSICENYEINSVTLSEERELNDFIDLIKNKDGFNYRIYFNCEDNESIEIVKSFKRKLELYNIEKVDVLFNFENKTYSDSFYRFLFYIECHSDHIILKSKKIIEAELCDEKRFITNDFLNDLIKDYFCLYFNLLTNSKEEELIRKYIFNHKLLLIDIDSLTEEEILLSRVSEEENDCSKINYCNILFYFLKDSNILKNMVTRSLNNCESEDYFTFRTILKDLEVDFIDGYQILLSNTNKILTPCIKNINEYLIDDISKKIRKLKVKNDTKNFKRLLNYFYNYLKNKKKIDVDSLLRIIYESIVNGNIIEKNIRIIQKILSYDPNSHNLSNESFYFYFFDENTYPYFEVSPIF